MTGGGAGEHCHLHYGTVSFTEPVSLQQFVIQTETLVCLCVDVSSPGPAPDGSGGKAAGVLTQEGGDAPAVRQYHHCT